MKRAALGIVAIAACFTGDSAQGLPCTADEYCAGLKCIDGFCGGPPDGIESATTTTTPSTTDSTGPTTTEPTTTEPVTTEPTTSMDSTSESTGGPATCGASVCWSDCFGLADQGTFAANGQPIDLEVAPMNGDTQPDLFTVNNTGEGMGVLEMRYGVAGGSFAGGAPTTRVLADAPTGTAVGSIDDVPHADAVTAYFGSNQVSVWLWAADDFNPITGAPLPTGVGPRVPVILDIDGIPPRDVAFATGSGIEAFTAITPDSFDYEVFANNVFIDDMIGVRFDGGDALLVAHLSLGEVTLYRLPVGTGVTEELRFVTVVEPAHVAVGDFDADGDDDDVVIATENGELLLAASFLAEAEPDDAAVLLGTFEGTPNGLAVGQIDGD
jgi:hypothetical protein